MNPATTETPSPTAVDPAVLERICRRALAWCTHMIWEANHRDDKHPGDPKVGGHPASCASSLHLAAGLHLVARDAADFYCAKPHLAPMDHALHYGLGFFRHPDGRWFDEAEAEAVMHRLRSFSRQGEPVFQSYHAEGDPDSWRILPSGTVGIPPVCSAYLALAYRYAADHGLCSQTPHHFWSIVGDSELREGSLMEAAPDIAERELGNVTWIVDYNRQNLDGTRIPNRRGLRGTDADRIERSFAANGWRVIQLRHGRRRQEVFRREGGAALRRVLEAGFGDYEYQALLWKRDAARIRSALREREPGLAPLLEGIDDPGLLELFADLGGHDMTEVLAAYAAARRDEGVPTLIIAHTIKGWGLECAARPGNHSSLPEQAEIDALLAAEGLDRAEPYGRVGVWAEDGPELALLDRRGAELRAGVEAAEERIAANRARIEERLAPTLPLPEDFGIDLGLVPMAHTQWVWGQVAGRLVRIGTHDELAAAGLDPGRELNQDEARWAAVADLTLTLSPDVGTSTNINPAMDAKIYGPEHTENLEAELELAERGRPELWARSDPWTRHIRFEIAEANCMSAAGSFGKMGRFAGVPFLPMMTVYDFFIKRALDQLYYDVYWRSSFILVGTPSGVTLSPEGAQHSWKNDLQMPSLITWEPAFAREMEWILADAVRRHVAGDNEDREGVLVRGVTRGLPQKEFLRRLRAQPRFAGCGEEEILAAIRRDVLAGGYKLVDRSGEPDHQPGENVVVILAMGAVVDQALAASDRLLAEGIHADVVVVTSPDLLLGRFARRDDWAQLRRLGLSGDLHLAAAGPEPLAQADARLLAARFVPLVSVADGEEGLLDNAGSILGVPQVVCAVRRFSKSGRPADVYRFQEIDAEAVVEAAGEALARAALREVRLTPAAAAGLAAPGRPAERNWRRYWPAD
ncbi:MAG: pyruvate dehydrogenase [Planctomycetota bacterium]|nr:MAG: pyruvate dehydrogenase [Planctomycetota bacterium]